MPDQQSQTIPTSEFVEVIRRSNVVDEDTLNAGLATFDSAWDEALLDADASSEMAKHLIREEVLTRYQAKELLQGKFRKLRMDHFVIRDLLGVGGMGAVFRAYDEARDEEVALKVLSERFKHDSGMRARFRLEARAGMRLDHPRIVKTFDLGVTDDVFGQVDYTTMELFEGIALHELVGIMGPIPVNAACNIVCQAADALDYLHEQGMVHRDVKPDNILIDKDGNVKVIDFGLTLIEDAAEGEEFSLAMIFGHECLGTPDYMPPEQTSNSQSADARSDVYSLGCTLFVALTGKRPFYGESSAELIRLHKSQQPPDPRTIVEKIPPEVVRAVLRMMAKSPDERFQSMEEVQEELRVFSVQRRIEFSFSRLLRNRMALAIKQGRITRRTTSSAMQLSGAGRLSRTDRVLDPGRGSMAALQATDAPRDTSVGREATQTNKGQRVGHHSTTTAASGAERVLQGMGVTDADATASGAMLKLPDGGLYRLTKAETVIGRSREEAELYIDDKRLSARHCRLTFDGEHWRIIDLESTNGTTVNGRRIGMEQIFGKDRITLGGEITLVVDWAKRRPSSIRSRWMWGIAIAIIAAILVGAAWMSR